MITVRARPACSFGMLYSCILRSHATRTEGAFCSVAGNYVLIFRHPVWAIYAVFGDFLFGRHTGRGGTLSLVPLYEMLVVPGIAQLYEMYGAARRRTGPGGRRSPSETAPCG